MNSLATNVGASAVGKLAPPPPINSIQVAGTQNGNVITAPSEILHWTMAHNGEVQKGARYFSEIDTNPNFTQPHVVDHGASRTGLLHLPAMASSGAKQTYYLKSYVQYPGSDPSEHTVLGGLTNATQIQMTGTSQMDLLPSTGSGTASPTGTQGGRGMGTVLVRPAPTTKRSLK